MQAGISVNSGRWQDVSSRTIVPYKRMIVTYEAALKAAETKLRGTP